MSEDIADNIAQQQAMQRKEQRVVTIEEDNGVVLESIDDELDALEEAVSD